MLLLRLPLNPVGRRALTADDEATALVPIRRGEGLPELEVDEAEEAVARRCNIMARVTGSGLVAVEETADSTGEDDDEEAEECTAPGSTFSERGGNMVVSMPSRNVGGRPGEIMSDGAWNERVSWCARRERNWHAGRRRKRQW
jgi:hypothetical protein